MTEPLPTMRSFDDTDATRDLVYRNTLQAVKNRFPIEDDDYRIELKGARYSGPQDFTMEEQKQALMKGRNLHTPISGTYRLVHRPTNTVLDEREDVVLHVPYYTQRGTMIRGGNEYTCLHPHSVVNTDCGKITIGEIVNKRLPVRVLSYDFKTRSFVYRQVVEWIKHPRNKEEKLVCNSFSTSGCGLDGCSTLWSTPDHKIYNTEGKTSRADSIEAVSVIGDTLTDVQLQLMYGSLLGDATIDLSSGILRFVHCKAQREYLEYKKSILGLEASDIVDIIHMGGPTSRDKQHEAANFSYRASFSVLEAMRICYTGTERKRKKQITPEWLEKVGPLGLAFWFMDDGSSRRLAARTDAPGLTLHTQGFDVSGVEILVKWLATRWGIHSFYDKNKKLYGDKDYGAKINISGETNVYRFLRIISPYVCECMRYKLLAKPKMHQCQCGSEISRNRRRCVGCLKALLSEKKPSKSLRHHFPGLTRSGVAAAFDAGELSNYDSMYSDWVEIQSMCGSLVPKVIKDCVAGRRLVSIPAAREQKTINRVYASAPYVYDITVEDTHNYFANGVLVSNCASQARLRPGVYVRRQRTGEVEAHVNVKSGTGKPMRIQLEPKSGVFSVNIGQSSTKLYPLMKAMGVTDKQLIDTWGPELAATNIRGNDAQTLGRIYGNVAGYKVDHALDQQGQERYLREELPKFQMDPEVNAQTIGLNNATGITPEVLLRATKKVLNVSRGDEDPDERDAPQFSSIHGIEDLIQERIDKDAGRLTQTMLRKVRRSKNLQPIYRGAMSPYIDSFIVGSGLVSPGDETNPLSTLEQMNRITKLGVGGIGDPQAITAEARDVNPGQLGIIDLIAGPESESAGIDVRAVLGSKKGSDNKIYGEFNNAKTGKIEALHAQQIANSVVAFPGQMKLGTPTVYAMKRGKVEQVPRSEVQYEVPSLGHMFSSHINLNPMPTAVQAGRQFYGAKFWSQYMPQLKGEVPLVESLMADGKTTYSEYYGRKVGTLKAKASGTVTKVSDDTVTITDAKGNKHVESLVKNFPFNRLSSISYYPAVELGQQVTAGDMVAHSNYTDKKTGALTLGQNLSVAVIPYKGDSYEDSAIISESAAKKLSTDRLLGYDMEARHGIQMGRSRYISLFPKQYTTDQIDKLDENGVAKPGSILNKGDPIVLATGPRLLTSQDAQLGKLHKALRNTSTDKSLVWEYAWPGTVTDTAMVRNGARVNVKSTPPVAVGDKLSSRFGIKGVVGRVCVDSEMPRNSTTNQPYDMLLNPMTILSRTAPNQIMEMTLGKIAKATGKQVRIPQDPPPEGWEAWVKGQMDAAGVSESSDLFDPSTGKTVKNIGDGHIFISAFHHLAEKKLSSRGEGGYDANEQPSRGGSTGSKKYSMMDQVQTLAHGAGDVIKDVIKIRGTKNEDYWKALKLGKPIPEPGVPFIYTKFLNTLKAGGINLGQEGDTTRLLPMMDRDVDALSKGTIQTSDMVDSDFEPIPGGLFDVGKTGGSGGSKWSEIQLPESIPNPVMEEPIRRLLGLRVADMENILAGRQQLDGITGGPALKAALDKINIDDMIASNTQKVRTLRGSNRDNAIKILGYLSSAKQQSIHPTDWMISKVPVLPPMFRPISKMGDVALTADINELYRDVIESSNSYRALSPDLPDAELADERLNVYRSVKAAYGLGDSITTEGQSKHLKGAIRQVIGSSPKCYDDATEVLTRTGWVPWPNVMDDTIFGTMNPATGELEYQQSSEVIHSPYTGIMVRTSTKKLDLLVTPNHQHYVERRKGNLNKSRAGDEQWLPFNKMDAGRFIGSTRRVRFLSAPICARAGITPCFTIAGRSVPAAPMAEFLGRWLAEGWASTSENQVQICQAFVSTENVCRIDALFVEMGIPIDKRTYSNNHWWVITDPEFSRWVINNFGSGAENKKISDEIKAWDPTLLRRLIQGYLYGDGEAHVCSTNPSLNKTYYHRDPLTNYGNRSSTVSRQLVDDFMVVSMHVGLGCRLLDTLEHPDKPAWKTQYRFRFDGWNRVIVEYPTQTYWEEYTGYVHCATVPNGLLIVRRNGKTAVSGNSGMWQSKVLSKTVDNVGRGVITPDPNLDMDQMGIPEDSAWAIYKDFIMRNLVRHGYPALRATELLDKRLPEARAALDEEMANRVIIADRAPTWHKFNLMAFHPHIVEGHTIRLCPLVSKGFNADHDGDFQVNTLLFAYRIKSFSNKRLLTCTLPFSTVEGMNNKNLVPVLGADYSLCIMDLSEFPHGELINHGVGSNGPIDFYAAIPDMKVLALDEVTGRPVWADVAYYSVHPNRELEIVTLQNGRQIFTDDDPRAVYGIDTATSFEYVRCTPSDALKRKVAVPCLKDGARIFTTNNDDASIQITDDIVCPFHTTILSWDFGHLLGALCGDGWWDKKDNKAPVFSFLRRIYVADLQGYIAAKVDSTLRKLVPNHNVYHLVHKDFKIDHPDRYGDSVKHTFGFEGIEPFTVFLTNSLGGERDEHTSGSGNKHLPAWAFTAPDSFKRGLLCGLVDTDGTCSVTEKVDRVQLVISFSSTSLRLCREVVLLARSLGIGASLCFSKTTSNGNTSWLVSFSSVDCKRTDIFADLQTPGKRDAFINTSVNMDITHGGDDRILFSDGIATIVRQWIRAPRVPEDSSDTRYREARNRLSLYQQVYQGCVRKTITRNSAYALIEELTRMESELTADRTSAIAWLKTSPTTCTPTQIDTLRRGVRSVAAADGDRKLYKLGQRLLSRLNKPLRDGLIPPTVVRDALEFIQSRMISMQVIGHPTIQRWIHYIVDNMSLSWSTVESVEKTGQREDGYDLTVPGYETFMSVDGIVLSNTMNFHVPASDRANEQAEQKMLPSRNLFSLTDLRSVRYSPSMEMTSGLFALTKPANKKPVRKFISSKAAEAAYRSGDLGANDPIQIAGQ